eukprot:3526561-Rhodomonas_salina.1
MSGADVVSAFVCVPKAKVLRWSFDADAVFCARLRLRFPLPLRFPFPFPFPESRRAPTHGASQQHTGRYCSRPAFALKQKKQLRCGVKAKPRVLLEERGVVKKKGWECELTRGVRGAQEEGGANEESKEKEREKVGSMGGKKMREMPQSSFSVPGAVQNEEEEEKREEKEGEKREEEAAAAAVAPVQEEEKEGEKEGQKREKKEQKGKEKEKAAAAAE